LSADPDLARLVEAWPALGPDVKTAVLALAGLGRPRLPRHANTAEAK
jgi:hypothetical protein